MNILVFAGLGLALLLAVVVLVAQVRRRRALESHYSGEITGLAVRLPDWQYPVVIDTASGQVQYDNFEGRWGGKLARHSCCLRDTPEPHRGERPPKGLLMVNHYMWC